MVGFDCYKIILWQSIDIKNKMYYDRSWFASNITICLRWLSMKVRWMLKSNIGNHQKYPYRNIQLLKHYILCTRTGLSLVLQWLKYFSESSYTSIFLTNHNTSNYLVFTLNAFEIFKVYQSIWKIKKDLKRNLVELLYLWVCLFDAKKVSVFY